MTTGKLALHAVTALLLASQAHASTIASETDLFSLSALAEPEAVVLDVRGMKCGGCSAAVKRIILTCPDVRSASVNLLTESAVVRLPPDVARAESSSIQKVTALLTSKVPPGFAADPSC